MEKTGRYTPPDISDKEEVEVGNLLEAFIRREMVAPFIRKKLGIDVEVIDPTHMYRNNERPWQLINPDGFLIVEGRTVGLEIKTGSSYTMSNWGGRDGDEVPDPYGCQGQHYMAGTGLDEWWTFGLIGNVRVLRIMKRNEEFIQRLNAAEADLWEIVKLNDPLYFPLPGGTDGDMDALMQSRMYADETTMDLSAYTDDVNRYIDLKVEIDDRTEERERVKQKIIQAMDRARYAVTDYHRLTVADNGRLWIKYL
jgi:predicted phage-related endonuclease